MILERIETNLKKIESDIDKNNFIYQFLEAYEQPKSSIKRLKDGDYNLSKKQNEVIWKKKVYFYIVKENEDVHDIIDSFSKSEIIAKYKIRFVIVTDFKDFLSIDKKNNSSLDIKINELSKNVEFFLPLNGLEKNDKLLENLADIKAAEKMGQLFDAILENDSTYKENKEKRHNLNIFFSRLLFCFFADDAEIFPKDQFKNSLIYYASENEDLTNFLSRFFKILGTKERKDAPAYLKNFPYVNGGLFNDKFHIPKLTEKATKIILQCSELNWALINPDIFGSMMQAVVSENERGNLGMHYTSVENIMKVIKPLFLDNILEDLEKSNNEEKNLKKILKRIYNLIIIDPACGSGNFLIISYKELCKIEIEIYKRLQKIDKEFWSLAKSGIRLNQFYGIEIDDFATETSKLSLWIAEHQMNLYFKEVFGETKPTLPLSDSGKIFCENATRIDWEDVLFKFHRYKKNSSEIYILGNPPYKGYAERNKEQKEDVKIALGNNSKLDYIGIWFIKAAKFIKNKNAKFAFVTTNSIHQGEQVILLWPQILKDDLEIFFSYNSFKWNNNAKFNAGVICSIIGISKKNKDKKKIFLDGLEKKVSSINSYLTSGESIIVSPQKKPLSNFPLITKGDIAYDGGFLSFTASERLQIVEKYKDTDKYFRRFIGGADSMRGFERWCLWVNEAEYKELKEIPELKKRFNFVKQFRLSSNRATTAKMAEKPYRFIEIRKREEPAIIVPVTSSSRRVYIPINFVDKHSIINASNQAIYNSEIHMFSILSSKMHMIWVQTVGGKMKNDYRYSAEICYNTFPFPRINNEKKELLKKMAFKILDIREKFSEKSIAELYDPKYMPGLLLKAHEENDLIVQECYSNQIFSDDDARLAFLLEMYKNMNKSNELF